VSVEVLRLTSSYLTVNVYPDEFLFYVGYIKLIIIDQKQLENVESFKYLGSILTNDGRCTCEIKCSTAMAKAAFNKKRALFISTLD